MWGSVRACVRASGNTHTHTAWLVCLVLEKTFIDISFAACHYSSAMKHIQTNTHVMLRHLVLPDTDEYVCVCVCAQNSHNTKLVSLF